MSMRSKYVCPPKTPLAPLLNDRVRLLTKPCTVDHTRAVPHNRSITVCTLRLDTPWIALSTIASNYGCSLRWCRRNGSSKNHLSRQRSTGSTTFSTRVRSDQLRHPFQSSPLLSPLILLARRCSVACAFSPQ